LTLSQTPTGAITGFNAIGIYTAEMQFIGNNRMGLFYRGTNTAFNASTTVTAGTGYIGHMDYTRDGLHYSGLAEDKIARDGDFSYLNHFKV
jgi:hypothetical protein